ncbi:MAG: domain containing protein [Firmicutes bacterium]|nr:domain containing protein [Bacillota bacterium]
MVNSDKMVRLLKIISVIEQRNGATLQALIDECEVCERTIYRDIEALSMGGMPIHFNFIEQFAREIILTRGEMIENGA